MNKERALEIAREAGFLTIVYGTGSIGVVDEEGNDIDTEIQAFAALLRAEFVKEMGEPVAWARSSSLKELQYVNGMSIWCESPSVWESATPPNTLTPIYKLPRDSK
jgi:hypothetical protein